MVYRNIMMIAASVCVGIVSSDDPPFDVRDFALFAPDIIEADRSYFNAPPNDYSSRDTFDVIIVGAGTAGSVLASRLTEKSDCSVLVLEAGEEETLFNDVPLLWFFSRPVSDWNYTTVPMENGCPRGLEGRCPYPRGKVLGGSSSTNLMAYLRGNPGDFDDLAKELDDESWSYNRMLKYFKKGENMTIPELRNSRYHSTEGAIQISYLPFTTKITQAVLDAAQEMGIPEIDYNGAQQEGVSRIQTFSSNGNRVSASRGYLWPAAKRQNLYLRLRSFVTQILFDDAKISPPLARGVRYEREGKIREAYAKEVILCAGAVNSAQLLLLSGVGPRDQLEKLGIRQKSDVPVGENFYDHTAYLGQPIVLNTSLVESISSTVLDLQNYVELVLKGTGNLTNINGLEMFYFFEAGNTSNRPSPNMEMFILNFPPPPNPQVSSVDIYRGVRQNNSIVPVLLPRYPVSKGSVTLSSTDVHDPPNIFPNFFGEEQDVTNAVEGVKKMLKIFDTEAFRQLGATIYEKQLPGCESYDYGTDEYFRCAIKKYSITAYDACCSVKMGKENDPSTVVTTNFKVKGLQNLRVVDASVFPIIISGNMEASTLAIAEKAAEMIKKEL